MPPRHLVLLFPIDQGQQIDHMIKNPPEWRLHTQIEWLDMLMIVETGNLSSLATTLVFFLDCTWSQFRWLQAKQPSMLEHATSALRLAHCSKFGSISLLSATLMSIPVVRSFRTCPIPRLHAVAGVTPETNRGNQNEQFRLLHHNTSS